MVEFLATLAHELKSPIAPLSNALELLRLRPNDAALQENVRGIMERQVQHLAGLVDGLLDVTRFLRGSIALDKTRADLIEVLQNAIEVSRPQLALRGQRVELSGADQSISLEVDKARLSQAIAQLIAAVGQDAEDGGEIGLSVEIRDASAILLVRNRRAEVPRELWDAPSEPGSDRVERRGVGMMLAKSIVELHDGRMEVRQDGSQETFVVVLPLETKELVATAPENSGALVKRRVLVIDDTRAAAYLLGQLLEALGQDVEICHDAPAGLEAARREKPDIIISDITMPRMDGYEFARRVREDDSLRNVGLIALTGHGNDAGHSSTEGSGFDHYLVKPVDIATLRELLSR